MYLAQFNTYKEVVMGRFSTTVHVKDNVGRIEFINSFCGIMKNHGFVPCSEDEAEQSYVFAFGEGWVTLVNKDYKDDRLKAGDDAMNMSAALKTSAFMMDVIDSDFAYIHLFAPNGGKDGVAVGDTSGYGVEKPKRGKQKFWKPLLAEGKTWEQFSETVAKMHYLSRKLWWRWRRNSKLIRITFTRISMS